MKVDPRDSDGAYYPIDGSDIVGLKAGVRYVFVRVHPDVVGTFGGLQSMIVHFIDTTDGEQVIVRYEATGLAF